MTPLTGRLAGESITMTIDKTLLILPMTSGFLLFEGKYCEF